MYVLYPLVLQDDRSVMYILPGGTSFLDSDTNRETIKPTWLNSTFFLIYPKDDKDRES